MNASNIPLTFTPEELLNIQSALEAKIDMFKRQLREIADSYSANPTPHTLLALRDCIKEELAKTETLLAGTHQF